MKRFKVEDKRMDNGTLDGKPMMYITLAKGPYTKKRILNKTGWLTKNATITEITMYNDIPEEDND